MISDESSKREKYVETHCSRVASQSFDFSPNFSYCYLGCKAFMQLHFSLEYLSLLGENFFKLWPELGSFVLCFEKVKVLGKLREDAVCYYR